MEEQTCKTCRYFSQHYSRLKNFWLTLHEGHCTKSRFKTKDVDSPACQHYSVREDDISPIVLKGEFSVSICDIPPEITQLFIQDM